MRMLPFLLIALAGCAGNDRPLPERTSPGTYSSTLAQPTVVCHVTDNQDPMHGYRNLATVTIPLSANQGDTLYLFAKSTALRVATGDTTSNLLEVMRISCPGRSVQSTRNHRGTSSVDQQGDGMVQYASLLYHPEPDATEVTCQLQAYVGGATDSTDDCLSFQPGDTNTWLHPYAERGGWAWGTNHDAHNAQDNNNNPVTIIGPGSALPSPSYPSGESPDLGSSGYVLQGEPLSADPAAKSLSVVDDLELTCEASKDLSNKLCDVTATLLVQRMASPSSLTVCNTFAATQTRTLNWATHHEKLYLRANEVPFDVVCGDGSHPIGRSFIVKSQVTLNSGHDNRDYVIVERGLQDEDAAAYHSGFSITSVLQNF